MRVTIDFEDEINPAVQQHLDGGKPVRSYVRAAVAYFNTMLLQEQAGNKCGYGDKSRFTSYNHEVSPKQVLDEL